MATYTWTGAINNNWSNNGNWNVGGSYPDGADDDAIINSGTPLLDVGVTVGTVTIGSGITLDCASQNFTFTSLFSDGTLKLVGNQATQVITNMDISSGDVTYYGFVAGTIRLIEFYDLIIAGFSTYTLNAAIVVYGDLSISSGTLDVSGSDYQITVTGDWVAGAGSFTEQSGKVTMNGTGTVPFETFYQLEIDGGVRTATAALTISDQLILTSGTFVPGLFTHNVDGDWDDSGVTFVGTNNPSSVINLTPTSNVNITQGASNKFGALNISNGATLLSNIACASDLTVSGGTLTCGSYDITIGKDLTISGTLATDTSKFIFNDASLTSEIAAGAETFYNFECITPGKTIEFEESVTIDITNIFNIQGSASQNVFLRSAASPTQWGIDNSGGLETIEYADIKDSSPVLSNDITATSSWDSGNNDVASPGWIISGFVISPDSVQLRLYSPTGELLTILSDTDETGSILNAIVKVNKIGGVDNFSFRIDRNVSALITRNTECYFYINRLLWFIGIIKETPRADQSDPVLVIEGDGFYKRLFKKVINVTYTTQTLDAIVKAVANTYLGADVNVYYDVAKIATPSVSNITIQFKDKNLFQVFNTLLEIANYNYDTAKYRFYVDTEKDLVFELLSEDIVTNIFEGYQYYQPEVTQDNSKIINKVFAFRTKTATPGEVEYVNTYEDTASQGKYGLFVKKITFPDYADTTTIIKMVDFILKRRAEPQDKIKIENYVTEELLSFGKYGISNRRDLYWKVAAFCDSLTDWDVSNLDDTTLALSTTHVLTGRQSLKFTTATGSINEYAELVLDVAIPLPQVFRMYIYFESTSINIKVTLYDEDGNELDIDFASIFTDQWLKYTKDNIGVTVEEDLYADSSGEQDLYVDSSGEQDLYVRDEVTPQLNALKTIRITILEDVATVFYIDLFDVFANTYNYHELQVEEIEYRLNARGIFTDINFGEMQDSIIDEIKGQVKEGNIALDIFSKQ